jgi:hypothetical protein
MHDPRLGRFFAIDPLAKDYPDISPYVFVANSPILLIDSDGRKIILAGNNKEENDMQLAVLQKLTNDKLAYDIGSKTIYVVSKGTENTEKKLNMGTSLVNALINDQKDDCILATRVATLDPDTEGDRQVNAQNGQGASSKVNMTYGKKLDVYTANLETGLPELTDTPEEIVLGHELIHAYYIMIGKAIPSTKKEEYSYNVGKGIKTKSEEIEELRVVGISPSANNENFTGCDEKYTENGLREEQGLGPRLKY